MGPGRRRDWRERLRRTPALSAWPFVVVILMQTAVAGFSVYTLSACRAYVTGESLWSKGQHEAIYFLDLYLDTGQRSDFQSFKRAIKVTLAYRVGRQFLESRPPDLAAARAAFVDAGNPPQDIPRLMWTFRHFRGVPYLEDAIARWKEADQYILELDRLGTAIGAPGGRDDAAASRKRLEEIDVAITPRTIAFSRALNDGARMVEWLLMVVNLGLAGVLGLLTIWRVGRVLKQRRQIEEKLVWQASHDELTGLPNRRAFEDALARAMTPTERVGGASCALMFIDLDQFKIVNDTCGHAAGDALLRRICAPLQAALGERDLLARLGGDEFSILMPGATRDHAFAVAESLRAAVEQIDFVWEGRIFGVTASIGLVHDAGTAITAEQMMRAADMACFMAKERGRNRVQAHLEEDAALLGRMREMNWVQRIHQALNDDRFCLYAQEIVALADAADDDMHLEVLIRMRDERGALIPPSSFLPAAERFGLVRLIDRWVVRSAFRILAQRNAMPDLPAIGRCAINLSGATIGDETFLDLLKDAFAEFGVPPEIICFEVTETSAIVNLDDARAFIQDLRGLGCTFALDDFGSGMSSLNYLKALPVDFLKIDGGFVRNILDDRADRAMVEMISHVGHVMGKRIIAEFVESQAIADALREIGVDYGQGHGIAPPKPFDARFMGVATASYHHHERYPRLTA